MGVILPDSGEIKWGITTSRSFLPKDNNYYKQFTGRDGNSWLKIPSLTRGQMLCIPLNSNIQLKGCLRIILKNGVVHVHHTIEQKKFEACGDLILGVDKGYSEAYANSEGHFHEEGLGEILTTGTEKRNKKGIARNKLHQIAKKNLIKQQIFIHSTWEEKSSSRRMRTRNNLFEI